MAGVTISFEARDSVEVAMFQRALSYIEERRRAPAVPAAEPQAKQTQTTQNIAPPITVVASAPAPPAESTGLLTPDEEGVLLDRFRKHVVSAGLQRAKELLRGFGAERLADVPAAERRALLSALTPP